MGIQGSYPTNGVSPVNYPDIQSSEESEQSSAKKALSSIKGKVTGKISSFLSIPDTYPKLRVVFDVGIIALSVIAITAILAASGGQGMMLFSLIPCVLFAALGVALLISDVVKNPKTILIAQKVAAVLTPLLLAGAAAALFVAATYSGGMGVMLVATPQFALGLILVGLSLVSLNKVTMQAFKNMRAVSDQNTQTTITPKIDAKHEISAADKKQQEELEEKTREAMKLQGVEIQQKTNEKRRSRDYTPPKVITTVHSVSSDAFPETRSTIITSKQNVEAVATPDINEGMDKEIPSVMPSPLVPLASNLPSLAHSSIGNKNTSTKIKPVNDSEKGKSTDDDSQKEKEEQEQQNNKAQNKKVRKNKNN